ncbi:ATP synthase F0 subcomplex B subunit [Proteiniborus ethanoligenes]|uniref:ATP synthase subunit b n=1 Tax=Proteiniborus ethanoligenes TaxID=415015 RepID=A0A1H3LSB1_9FIRM|nr:F0F1 ATP synthase subunit B [Proteiniborus ethanoligenes]SDY67243.1 ATP synthase F0 subcomplex B subunit [Proteiniborus ethanoligenes]
MDVQINVLPDLVNFSLQIAATIVLFLILRHFLFGPVSGFLNARKEKIAKDIDEAKLQREEANALRLEYESRIDEAKNEARVIVDSAKKRGEELKDQIVVEAKTEASNVLAKAKSDIQREREKTMADLKSEVVQIAMMAAEKVVEKSLDEKAHNDMINKFIDEVGEAQWQN